MITNIMQGMLEQAVREATCPWCDEAICPDDEKVPVLGIEVQPHKLEVQTVKTMWHLNCSLRQVYGSVGHQLRRCGCYGGKEWDPPEMTKRQAADAAVAHWRAHNSN